VVADEAAGAGNEDSSLLLCGHSAPCCPEGFESQKWLPSGD